MFFILVSVPVQFYCAPITCTVKLAKLLNVAKTVTNVIKVFGKRLSTARMAESEEYRKLVAASATKKVGNISVRDVTRKLEKSSTTVR